MSYVDANQNDPSEEILTMKEETENRKKFEEEVNKELEEALRKNVFFELYIERKLLSFDSYLGLCIAGNSCLRRYFTMDFITFDRTALYHRAYPRCVVFYVRREDFSGYDYIEG